MQTYLEFIEVDLPNKTNAFVQVNDSHLEVFGILRDSAACLRLADNCVRELAQDEYADLDHLDLAYHMAAPVPGQSQVLPLNQCVRWQLLRYTLGELALLEATLGAGLQDIA